MMKDREGNGGKGAWNRERLLETIDGISGRRGSAAG